MLEGESACAALVLALFLRIRYSLLQEWSSGSDGRLAWSLQQLLCWTDHGYLVLAVVLMIHFPDFFFFLRAVLMIAASDLLELLRRAKCPLNNCLKSSQWIVRDITISIATNGLSRRILYFWNLRGTGRSCCDHDWEHECSAELGKLLHAAQ